MVESRDDKGNMGCCGDCKARNKDTDVLRMEYKGSDPG